MTDRAQVTTTARLHLGFFDLGAGPGRRFGSIGLALDSPVTRLTVRRATTTQVTAIEARRVGEALSSVTAALRIESAHRVDVETAVPQHAGLGSGTQLGLAIAAALRRLHGMPLDTRADARTLNRGARSGIGIALFSRGGLVIDGGRTGDHLPPALARLPLPPDWRILLLLDPHAAGLSGAPERAAFTALPPMRPAVSGEICRHVLLGALPGLAETDLPAFGAAITAIQGLLGDYFAPAQGGRFSSTRVSAALDRLAALGAHGLGQSSWGPTGFAFAASQAEADRLTGELASAEGLDIRVARGLNRGAAIALD